MTGGTRKILKKLVCAGIITLALAVGAREVRATIVEVTDVQIIRGELVGGWFQEIEDVDELMVGHVFVIRTEVTNLGSETEHVSSLYGWDLSPENCVELIGTSIPCFTSYDLEPGDSAVLLPFCPSQAFRAEEYGWVTMNIYVKDWVSENLCQYTFEFSVIPEPSTIAFLGIGLAGLLSHRHRRFNFH